MTTTGNVVLITGAARRIGRALALDLAANGWAVAVHFNRSAVEANGVVEEIAAAGGRAAALAADLRVEAESLSLVERSVDELGPLNCLINNASVFEPDTPETATRHSWDLHMEVNLRAPFVLAQEFMRQLPDGREGNIINLIDQRVWNLGPDFTSYTLSKVGLWGLTQTLARAAAPRIRVNAIGPGPVLPSRHQTEQEFVEQWSTLPLQRQVGTEDICAGVRYILDAAAMTGQMIALDAGEHLGGAPEAAQEQTPE